MNLCTVLVERTWQKHACGAIVKDDMPNFLRVAIVTENTAKACVCCFRIREHRKCICVVLLGKSIRQI